MQIYATEGYIFTNGNGLYGKIIDLGKGDSENNYYEITLEEYENILKNQEATENALL